MMLHPFAPSFFNKESKILILGSFPSIKSREVGFYYAHSQNRFWKILGALFEVYIPIYNKKSLESKNFYLQTLKIQDLIKVQKDFLIQHNIVLWDMIQSCEVSGSSDTSIKNAIPNDLTQILAYTPFLHLIVLNGATAANLFCRFYGYSYNQQSSFPKLLTPIKKRKSSSYSSQTFSQYKIFFLPSTSPANAQFNFERLLESWKIIKDIKPET